MIEKLEKYEIVVKFTKTKIIQFEQQNMMDPLTT